MKLKNQLLAVPVLALAMTSAFAADMNVKGKIMDEGCTAEISSAVDWAIDLDTSQPTEHVVYAYYNPSVGPHLLVNCPKNTSIALKATDQTVGEKPTGERKFFFNSENDVPPTKPSLTQDQYFGLGVDSKGTPIGALALRLGGHNHAGNQYLVSNDGIEWGNLPAAHADAFLSDSGRYFSPAKSITEHMSAKFFRIPLQISASITRLDELDTSQELNIEGGASIEVSYL
jgi:hypothetical protein